MLKKTKLVLVMTSCGVNGAWATVSRILLRTALYLIGYTVSDAQLIEWLKACKRAKRDDKSVIIVKENVTSKGDREYDEEDRSWTRSVKLWKQLFIKADLQLFREEKQNGFPTDLFAVWMWVAMHVKHGHHPLTQFDRFAVR